MAPKFKMVKLVRLRCILVLCVCGPDWRGGWRQVTMHRMPSFLDCSGQNTLLLYFHAEQSNTKNSSQLLSYPFQSNVTSINHHASQPFLHYTDAYIKSLA